MCPFGKRLLITPRLIPPDARCYHPDLLSAGRRLSHYTIAEPIGQSGMGVVCRAIDARLDRTVALKVIAGDASWIDLGWTPIAFEEVKAHVAAKQPAFKSFIPLGDQSLHDEYLFVF